MKHSNFGENDPPNEDSWPYEPDPNGFLARAAAEGFEDDINALTNHVLDDESRAYFRRLIDQHGLFSSDFNAGVEQLQCRGKIASGFYRECVLLRMRIQESISKAVESRTGKTSP